MYGDVVGVMTVAFKWLVTKSAKLGLVGTIRIRTKLD